MNSLVCRHSNGKWLIRTVSKCSWLLLMSKYLLDSAVPKNSFEVIQKLLINAFHWNTKDFVLISICTDQRLNWYNFIWKSTIQTWEFNIHGEFWGVISLSSRIISTTIFYGHSILFSIVPHYDQSKCATLNFTEI